MLNSLLSIYNLPPCFKGFPQRFTSRSSSQLWLNSDTIYSPLNNGQYYIPSNQTPDGFNSPPMWNPFYKRSSFNSDIPPGLPNLSSITYNPATDKMIPLEQPYGSKDLAIMPPVIDNFKEKSIIEKHNYRQFLKRGLRE
jgi:hypothetical protein